MARGVHSEALQHVRMLFEAGAVGGLTDRQLLERFRAREGEAAELAFAALVERHGPMVLRVCRRILRDEHDAQDAFQATFLVLVRKAGSLHAHDSLGGWLHAVACRVAACARAAEARRRVHRAAGGRGGNGHDSGGQRGWDDLGPVLHEEIGRLPETYRAAVVLCDLEGLTQEQAAQRLGWPSGTVRSRLARAGDGCRPGSPAGASPPPPGPLPPCSQPRPRPRRYRRHWWNHGPRRDPGGGRQTIAGAVAAAAFSEGVLRAMFMTRLKLISAALLAIGAGAGGTAVLALQQAEWTTGPCNSRRPNLAVLDRRRPPRPSRAGPKRLTQDPPEAVEHQISLAELNAEACRGPGRLVRPDVRKGLRSKAQNIADKAESSSGPCLPWSRPGRN